MAVGAGYLIWIFLPLPIKFVMLATFLLLRVRDSRKERDLNEDTIREINAAVNANDTIPADQKAAEKARRKQAKKDESSVLKMLERALQWVRDSMGQAVANACRGMTEAVMGVRATVEALPAAVLQATRVAAQDVGRGGLAVARALGPAALVVAQHQGLVPNRVAEAEEDLRR
jgi:hypothetical protein